MVVEHSPDIEPLPLEQLDFDRRNPRLLRLKPDDRELSDTEIAQILIEGWDPKPIGRSLSEYGFFPSEPLIVFQEGNRYIVAEGNRRLLAARLLTDPGLRTRAGAPDDWEELGAQLESSGFSLDEVPCQIVPNREAAAPVIGYRHIVGIAKWEAYDKAAFVAHLIKEGDRDFESVSDLVGETPSRVKRYLRDYVALGQAERAGTPVEDAKDEFGRFERAMQASGTREYVGGKTPAEMDTTGDTSVTNLDAMRKLIGYLYGLPDGTGPLFTDTRRIDELATALRSEEGRRILEVERDLDRAFDAAGGRRSLVLKGLGRALSAIVSVTADFPGFSEDEEVGQCVDQIRDALDQLPTGEAAAVTVEEEGDDYDLESDEEYTEEALEDE